MLYEKQTRVSNTPCVHFSVLCCHCVHYCDDAGWWEGIRLSDQTTGWFPHHVVIEITNEHQRRRNLLEQYRIAQAANHSFTTDSQSQCSKLNFITGGQTWAPSSPWVSNHRAEAQLTKSGTPRASTDAKPNSKCRFRTQFTIQDIELHQPIRTCWALSVSCLRCK